MTEHKDRERDRGQDDHVGATTQPHVTCEEGNRSVRKSAKILLHAGVSP
jgi:hypothetical protein